MDEFLSLLFRSGGDYQSMKIEPTVLYFLVSIPFIQVRGRLQPDEFSDVWNQYAFLSLLFRSGGDYWRRGWLLPIALRRFYPFYSGQGEITEEGF